MLIVLNITSHHISNRPHSVSNEQHHYLAWAKEKLVQQTFSGISESSSESQGGSGQEDIQHAKVVRTKQTFVRIDCACFN